MSNADSFFEARVEFDPAAPFELFLRRIPARWAIYLFADEADRPVQLLCVRNLRESLRHRLSQTQSQEPARKLNYREIVRHVHWRAVDSDFEADWLYLEAARQLFPDTYQSMVGFRLAWFLHVDPDAQFPRYVRTTDLTIRKGLLLGPVEDKQAASRLIELLEDSFDLCRYYSTLLQAPDGKACAYKEMGRCPAPCDGSISMEQYRQMIRQSAEAVMQPGDSIAALKHQMQEAARALCFEKARQLKSRIDRLLQLSKGAFRHARSLEDFRFISVQRGPRPGTVKLFVIAKGHIQQAAGVIGQVEQPAELLAAVLQVLAAVDDHPLSGPDMERIGLVSAYLYWPRRRSGLFLRADHVDEQMLAQACRAVASEKSSDTVHEEGLLKELQGS